MEPKKLAIYYGWPNTVKDWTVPGAVSVFKNYDLVIFGAGLENPNHGDHQNTYEIINHIDMSNTQVFGYITILNGKTANKIKIDDWSAMGVSGIFVDEYGFDYGNTRKQQNDIIDYIHLSGLKAFVNSWKPEDSLGNDVVATYNPSGTPHKLNTTDWYLCESYAVKNNNYDDTDSNSSGKPDWIEKAQKITQEYSGNIQIACIGTTGTSNAGFTQDMADFSYYATAIFGFHAWGWGEINYSSAGGPNSLPFRTRKTLPEGTKLIGPPIYETNKLERNTNVGIKIDYNIHSVSDRLD